MIHMLLFDDDNVMPCQMYDSDVMLDDGRLCLQEW